MIEKFNEKMTKDKIVASPVDEILKGVIIQIDKGILKDFLDEAVHSKFDNLDQETLKITFEVKFNNKVIKASDRIAYYSDPMTNSKLGKFLAKYDSLEVGKEIKVEFGGDGFGKIYCK